MKNLILFIVCIVCTTAMAQDPEPASGISLREKINSGALEEHRPLIVFQLNQEILNVGPARSHSDIADIPLDLVESIDILKGQSAVAIYGSAGANGVVILRLTNDEAGKNYFDSKKQEIQSTPVEKYRPANAYEEAISMDGETFFSLRSAKIDAVFVMTINHKEAYLDKLEDIEVLNKTLLTGVQILKNAELTSKYDAKGRDVIILDFKDSPESQKLFDTLKKVEKE